MSCPGHDIKLRPGHADGAPISRGEGNLSMRRETPNQGRRALQPKGSD